MTLKTLDLKSAPSNIVHKDLPVTGCKVVDAKKGIVEAFVSGIGNKDSVGDIIQPGAFDNFLKIRTPKGVWSHDWEKPISKTLEIYEVPAGDARLPAKMQLAGIGGLYVKTQFNLDTQLGRDSFSNVEFFGDEAEWSIGYQVHDQEWDGKAKAQLLHEIELYEYSPVLFGANPLTATVALKAHKGDDGKFEYEVQGLDDLTKKAVTAALDIILEEKKFSVEEVDENDDSAKAADDTDTKDSDMAEKKNDKPIDGALKALVGSYEERYETIAKALREWAEDIGYAYVYATFESKIIFYLYDYKNDNSGYFQVEYELKGDDEVEFGDALEVDVVEVVVMKAALEAAIKDGKSDLILDMLDGIDGGGEIATKAGRVLSAKNRSALSDALDAIKAVLEADEAEEKEAELTPQEKAELVLKSIEEGNIPSPEDLALLKSVVTPEVVEPEIDPDAEKDAEGDLDPEVDWDAVAEYVKAVEIEAEISEWSDEDLEAVKAWAEAMEAKDAESGVELDPDVDWEAVAEYVKAVAEDETDEKDGDEEEDPEGDESEGGDDEEEDPETGEKSEEDQESGEKVALDVSYFDMITEIDELEEFSAQLDD